MAGMQMLQQLLLGALRLKGVESWPVMSYWGSSLLQYPTCLGLQEECEPAESSGFWVGFVLCLSPQMHQSCVWLIPGFPAFMWFKIGFCADHRARMVESSNFNIALFPSYINV